MLALASGLSRLETDPQALGKRYQLTAGLPPSAAAKVRRIPGVEAVAPRYEDQAVDSYSLGETIDVIGYPGNHTRFEAPPLTQGHRIRTPSQAEVGAGLADALGLSPSWSAGWRARRRERAWSRGWHRDREADLPSRGARRGARRRGGSQGAAGAARAQPRPAPPSTPPGSTRTAPASCSEAAASR
jgi:hypothetical protein